MLRTFASAAALAVGLLGPGLSTAHAAPVQSSQAETALSEKAASPIAFAVSGSQLYIGWIGTDQHLNIEQSSDGVNFGNKQTLTDLGNLIGLSDFSGTLYVTFQGTESPPLLHVGVYDHTNQLKQGAILPFQSANPGNPHASGGTLYLPWASAVASDQHIHVSSSTTPAIPSSYHDVRLTDTASAIPEIGSFNSQLYVVFGASALPLHLHVGYFVPGNPNLQQGVTLSDTTAPAPGLGIHAFSTGGTSRLWIAWEGTDVIVGGFYEGHVNYESSSDGRTFTGKVTLGDQTFYGPSLMAFNGHLLLGYPDLQLAIHINEIA